MIVVTFHNVLDHSPGAFNMLARKEWVSLRAFEKQLDDLTHRYTIVPLADIANALRDGRELPDVCALTFDDGGLGGYRYAAPLLETRGLPATFFVVTGRLHDERAADPFDRLEALLTLTQRASLDLSSSGEEMLSTDCDDCKLRAYERLAKRLRMASPGERARLFDALVAACDVANADLVAHLSHEAYRSITPADARDLVRRGFSVGSHSATHVALSRLIESELAEEAGGSFRALTSALGGESAAIPFSYPFGKAKHISDAAVASVRKAGFACAVTMEPRSSASADLFRIPRIVYKEARKLARA